jgi:hypothetical protein
MRRQALFPFAVAVTLALPAAAVAQTLELPTRKSGLWEITMSSQQPALLPSMSQRICVDAATDRDLMDNDLGVIASGAQCTKLVKKGHNQTYVIDTDCALGPLSGKARTVISGDFSSAYRMRTESTMAGAGPFVVETAATWKSADCPGMAPGDVGMLGDNINVNIKQMKALLDPSARLMGHLPPRRPGQWEVHSANEIPGLGPPVSVLVNRLCIDPATDQATMEAGFMPPGCGTDVRRVGAEWLIEGKCDTGAVKMSTKATISGDTQSMITVRSEQTVEDVGSRPMTMIETRTARWVGPACADGMVPGDIAFSHGQKMNVAAPLAELERLLKEPPQGSPQADLERLLKALPQVSPPKDK